MKTEGRTIDILMGVEIKPRIIYRIETESRSYRAEITGQIDGKLILERGVIDYKKRWQAFSNAKVKKHYGKRFDEKSIKIDDLTEKPQVIMRKCLATKKYWSKSIPS